jgi:Dolichyl-phosphate-mannose-protein mannosyltransferase
MNLFVAAIVGCCAIARLLLTRQVPLLEDEAYYWEWSRHLAPGYVDHPPAVAWLIAVFSPPNSPVFIRFGFVLCGIIAGLALADTARILARRRGLDGNRAALVALCAFSFAPVTWFAFTIASPDGPYLAAWAAALWAAARVEDTARRRDMVILGVALATALLSRAFGFALVGGILIWSLLPERRWLWKSGLWLTVAVVAILYSPFVVWNGTHHWANFAFSIGERNELHALRIVQLWPLVCGAALMYSPGLWCAAIVVLVASPFSREPLIAWTAVPLAAVLTALAGFEVVGQYWYLGPYASLCVGMGAAYARARKRSRVVWTQAALIPAFALLLVGAVGAITSERGFGAVRKITEQIVRNDRPFQLYIYPALARDVASMARARHAGVMTTGYDIAGELDYHAKLAPIVIGDDYRGRESRRWTLVTHRTMILVERTPLSAMPSLDLRLTRSCKQLEPGPVLRYRFAGAPAARFPTAYCIGIDSREIAVLRALQPAH